MEAKQYNSSPTTMIPMAGIHQADLKVKTITMVIILKIIPVDRRETLIPVAAHLLLEVATLKSVPLKLTKRWQWQALAWTIKQQNPKRAGLVYSSRSAKNRSPNSNYLMG